MGETIRMFDFLVASAIEPSVDFEYEFERRPHMACGNA